MRSLVLGVSSAVLIGLTLLVWGGMSGADAQEAAPKAGGRGILTFEATTFDAGAVKQGAVVEASFKFTNTGTGPLTLGNIRTSCGCTAALVTSKDGGKTFAPGESGTISASLRTEHKRGPVSSAITVETDLPDQPAVVLTITVRVDIEVEMSPPYVVFGPVTPADKPTVRAVKVTNHTAKALVFKLVKNTRPDEVTTDWKDQTIPPGSSVSFEVTIKPKKAEPGFYANLQFQAEGGEDAPKAMLAISGQVTDSSAPAGQPGAGGK